MGDFNVRASFFINRFAGLRYGSSSRIHSLENVLPGSMGLEVTHSGYFLEYYFKHWSYQNKSVWIHFLVGLGLSYGISAAIAGLLVAVGWITVAVAAVRLFICCLSDSLL